MDGCLWHSNLDVEGETSQSRYDRSRGPRDEILGLPSRPVVWTESGTVSHIVPRLFTQDICHVVSKCRADQDGGSLRGTPFPSFLCPPAFCGLLIRDTGTEQNNNKSSHHERNGQAPKPEKQRKGGGEVVEGVGELRHTDLAQARDWVAGPISARRRKRGCLHGRGEQTPTKTRIVWSGRRRDSDAQQRVQDRVSLCGRPSPCAGTSYVPTSLYTLCRYVPTVPLSSDAPLNRRYIRLSPCLTSHTRQMPVPSRVPPDAACATLHLCRDTIVVPSLSFSVSRGASWSLSLRLSASPSPRLPPSPQLRPLSASLCHRPHLASPLPPFSCDIRLQAKHFAWAHVASMYVCANLPRPSSLESPPRPSDHHPCPGMQGSPSLQATKASCIVTPSHARRRRRASSASPPRRACRNLFLYRTAASASFDRRLAVSPLLHAFAMPTA